MKEYKACHVCEEDAFSFQLKHSKKTVYLDSSRFLPISHRYQRLRKAFNGSTEEGRAPKALIGEEVNQQVNHLRESYGKRKKITVEKNIWKKRSIFFYLPY